MRTEADLRAAAAENGLTIEALDLVPAGDGSGQRVMVARMSFTDPWAAARFLVRGAKEDASDPVVREYAAAILRATTSALGASASGPTLSPAVKRAVCEAIHRNVQQQIRFRKEPTETFQSARETLRLRLGDCDDHARLVMALTLALGIPAKLTFFTAPGETGPEPVHVVCEQKPGNAWTWAETTIPARWGENPYDAYARLELVDEDDPFGGMGRSRRAMGFLGLDFVTAQNVRDRKTELNATVQSLSADVGRCAALDAPTRAAWSSFASTWATFMENDPSWWDSGAQGRQAQDFTQQIHDWQTKIAALCPLTSPTIPEPKEDATLSTLKTLAVVAGVVAVAAGVRAVAK